MPRPDRPDDAFSGVFGVTVTPFTDDGSGIDEAGLRDLVGLLLDDRVDRIVPNGNTGEYHTLTSDERRRVVELTAEAAAGRARTLVAGVGGPIPDAIAASRHAAANGAHAVMVHHPVHPYVTADGLLTYLRRIADASPVPIIPYVKAALDETAVRGIATMPGVVAVKWGVNGLPGFARAVAIGRDAGSDVRWICGTAELWAPFFWAVGAVGFTSGLVNVASGPSFAMLDALHAGDRTDTLAVWAGIEPFEALRARGGDGWNVAVVKEAMRQRGRPAGPVRPPSSDVSAADRATIATFLAAQGLGAGGPGSTAGASAGADERHPATSAGVGPS